MNVKCLVSFLNLRQLQLSFKQTLFLKMSRVLPVSSVCAGTAASLLFYKTYDPQTSIFVPKKTTAFALGCNVGFAVFFSFCPGPNYLLAALNLGSALWFITQREADLFQERQRKSGEARMDRRYRSTR